MIKSELGHVIISEPTLSKDVNEAIIYADLAQILDEISVKFGKGKALDFIETYLITYEGSFNNDSRNEI